MRSSSTLLVKGILEGATSQDMADMEPELREELVKLILHGREERNLEYKGASGPDPLAWGPDPVKAKIARAAMGMANIGGGDNVIGMDEDKANSVWIPNGVPSDIDASYKQDPVQQYVNRQADPYVKLWVYHVEHSGCRFVIIRVAGFDELPVVCTRPHQGHLRQGAIYTRSFGKHETVEIQSQSEMQELLDLAIERGVERRLRSVFAELAAAIRTVGPPATDEERLRAQRGEL